MKVTKQVEVEIPIRRVKVSSQSARGYKYPVVHLAGPWLLDVGLEIGATVIVTPVHGGFNVRLASGAK